MSMNDKLDQMSKSILCCNWV